MFRERGMALAEVLVASAMAAAVIGGLLSVAATTSKARNKARAALEEGIAFRNIEAQIRVGIDPNLTMDDYPDWRIESAVPPTEALRDDGTSAVLAWSVIAPDGEVWPEIWVRNEEN